MEHYAVIQFMNGGFSVQFEGSNLDNMKYNYHNLVANIYNDAGAANGVVKLVDGNLDVVDGCVEFISKPAKG